MRDKILEALREVTGYTDFSDSQNLLEDGLLDSFEIVSLVSALEDVFDIEISGGDIIPENFVNLERIVRLIEKYRGEA